MHTLHKKPIQFINLFCIFPSLAPLPTTVSESLGTSRWMSTPVPGCPSPISLTQPTPSTTCTTLGWVHTTPARTSVSMPQVTGGGDHLLKKCALWICVLEAMGQATLPCAITLWNHHYWANRIDYIYSQCFCSAWTGWVVCGISYICSIVCYNVIQRYICIHFCEIFDAAILVLRNHSNHWDKPCKGYTCAEGWSMAGHLWPGGQRLAWTCSRRVQLQPGTSKRKLTHAGGWNLLCS